MRPETRPPVAVWIDRFVTGLLRRWLALILVFLGLFVTLPFLAPVLMAAGWTGLGTLIYHVYAPFCHQLPQRSWFLFGTQVTYTLEEIAYVAPDLTPGTLRAFYGTPEMGWKVAWSDRMISFYGLIPVFGLAYAWLGRRRGWRPLRRTVLLLCLLPILLDGTTHAVSDLMYGISAGGFRDTNAWLAWMTSGAFPGFYAGDHLGTLNWWLRLLTGALAAWGIAFWLFPWMDGVMQQEIARPNHMNVVPVQTRKAAGTGVGVSSQHPARR